MFKLTTGSSLQKIVITTRGYSKREKFNSKMCYVAQKSSVLNLFKKVKLGSLNIFNRMRLIIIGLVMLLFLKDGSGTACLLVKERKRTKKGKIRVCTGARKREGKHRYIMVCNRYHGYFNKVLLPLDICIEERVKKGTEKNSSAVSVIIF